MEHLHKSSNSPFHKSSALPNAHRLALSKDQKHIDEKAAENLQDKFYPNMIYILC